MGLFPKKIFRWLAHAPIIKTVRAGLTVTLTTDEMAVIQGAEDELAVLAGVKKLGLMHSWESTD